MLRNRLIAVLLVKDGALYNTKNFKTDKYVGDPINAVKIFNEKKCDELMICGYQVSLNSTDIDFGLIREVAEEANMPICYVGGVSNVNQAKKLISVGAEKIGISSNGHRNSDVVSEIINEIGAQSVVAVIDYKFQKKIFGKKIKVVTHHNNLILDMEPLELAQTYENLGVGEIVFNNVDRDGGKTGYDVDFLKNARKILNIPITALGGCGSLSDVAILTNEVGLIGGAASTIFLYKGRHDAVLIQYPDEKQKNIATEL